MSTFLLAVFAVLGTIGVLYDPTPSVQIWMKGRTKKELQAEVTKTIEEAPDKALTVGCKYGSYVALAWVYTLVIEPIYVLSALSARVGSQSVAYGMLAILAIAWIRLIRIFTKKENQKSQTATIMVQGTAVEGTLIELDKQIESPNPVLYNVRRIVFALPEMYLWYLFLIAIHIVS